jgi:low temperature requirement protein LtrA
MSGLLRERTGHEARVGTVELFFDLIFVFAITQLSHGLLAHATVLGAIETLILFLGIWWVWIYTSWVTNWLDPERWQVRMMLFALMACGLVLSMTIPQAWGARGLYFGVAFAVMQVGRSLFTMLALRRHDAVRYRNFQRITLWLLVSALLWIGGGLSEGPMRMALWAGALMIEYAGPFALFYVPGFGRSTTADWNVEGGHFAERCGLFIIIALGESILITGSTAASLPWTAPVLAAFASAFLGTVAMWWIYFNIGAERASHLIAHHDDPGRLARIAYTYGHIPVVAGIIVSAASDEMLVAHPTGHIAPAAYAMTLGGAALFLAGNMLFKGLTWTNRPLSHWIGLGLLALLAVLPFHDGYALGLATSGVLLIVAVWETWSLRGRLNAPPA